MSNLRHSVVQTLFSSLSFDQNERATAEDKIKILESTEDFGVILTEIIIEPSAQLEIRQLSSVLLKQYVDSHWSALSEEKFKPPEASIQAKSFIRQNLPNGLKDESSKIRTSVAYAMSRIASFDWPDAWPELFALLIEALHSMNSNIIHGAMRVFTEFAGEVSDLQIPHIAPVIFPEMLKIFTNPQIYGIRTSARAANIFSTIAGLIGLMKEFYKGIDKEHLQPYLPEFLAACSYQLSLPDGPTSDSGLKMEILKALDILVKNFPKSLSSYIADILPPVWTIFTQSVERYVKTTVNCTDVHDDLVDEDGEILSFENLVFSVFEFISALVESPKFKKTVEQYLEEILFFTMVYMQITDEQINLWSNDPNQFVEDEDEETLSFSVRISAQYLILMLCEKFKSAAEKLCSAVARLKQKGDELRIQGDDHWWKYHEACLLSLGYIQTDINEKLDSGLLKVDFKQFLLEFLISSCTVGANSSPFLLGQSFWTSSRYITILPDETVSQFLQATVSALQENQNVVLRVFAVKALFGFCDYLRSADKSIFLLPYLESIATGLLSMATQFTESVLAICLETLIIVMKVNEEFTSQLVHSSNVVPLVNALFLKHGADHHLYPLIEELIGEIVALANCFQVILEKTVPTLLSILEAAVDKIPPTFVPPTLDILTVIIRKSPKPLYDVFVKRSFPVVVKKVCDSDDEVVVQNGGECIRAFMACATEEVLSWQDGCGNNGLYYVIQACNKLLDPKASESSSAFVGKFINTLVMKAGNALGDNLEILLRSVLSKLQQAKTFTVTQSLLMVFIQLLRHQIEPTLEFLSTVPGPTGKSALDYVLTEWCSKQQSFFGNYETRASCDALCKLLLFTVTTGDKRFEEIVVPDDEVHDSKEIMTRSKAKQVKSQIRYIPVAIKFFKLILSELNNQIEISNNNEEESDEEEEEWEDIDDEESEVADMSVQKAIESLFSPAGDFMGFEDDDDEEEDPDTADDPINEKDLKAFLSQYVQDFSQQTCFSNFTHSLNSAERQTLLKIGLLSV